MLRIITYDGSIEQENKKAYCWRLKVSSVSMTADERKVEGFRVRRFSLTHFPYGLYDATRFFTSVFSYT